MEKYRQIIEKFPEVVGLEDPFHFEDWGSYASFTEEIGMNVQILGDTLTASSPSLVAEAVEAKALNGVVVRSNQSGTVTDMIQVVSLARTEGWGLATSACINEVDEDFLADFSVGVKSGLIKLGSLKGGSERLCKYNRLLRIESALGGDCYYAGDRWRSTG
jgi:enolase